jgi:hypothetical protein
VEANSPYGHFIHRWPVLNSVCLMGKHYFGGLVVVPRVGHKVKIGESRNEWTNVVIMGNILTGGWFVKRRKQNSRLVERRNPQAITNF